MPDASRCAGVVAVLFIAIGSAACSDAGIPTDTDAAWTIVDLPEGFVEESEKYVAGSRVSDDRGDGCRFRISNDRVPPGGKGTLRVKRQRMDTCEMVMAVGSYPNGRPARTTNRRVLKTNRPDIGASADQPSARTCGGATPPSGSSAAASNSSVSAWQRAWYEDPVGWNIAELESTLNYSINDAESPPCVTNAWGFYSANVEFFGEENGWELLYAGDNGGWHDDEEAYYQSTASFKTTSWFPCGGSEPHYIAFEANEITGDAYEFVDFDVDAQTFGPCASWLHLEIDYDNQGGGNNTPPSVNGKYRR